MSKHSKMLVHAIVVGAVALFAGCNDVIDHVPDVVLEVATLTIPSVSGAIDSTSGICVFTITQASGNFNVKPKNGLAITSPFNDVRLVDVTVNYLWDDGLGVTGPTVFPLAGTIPANGSATASFSIVNGLDIVSPSREGRTARLNLLFRGVTISGDLVSVPSGGALNVNTCQ